MTGPLAKDSGFTLIEALVALAISGFVLTTLGSLVSLVVNQRQRLSLAEQDVGEATAFAVTLDGLVQGIDVDPRAVTLTGDQLELRSAGAPMSAVADRTRRFQLDVEDAKEGRQLTLQFA